jgi:hypothetical protein
VHRSVENDPPKNYLLLTLMLILMLYAGFSPAYPMEGEAFRLKKILILWVQPLKKAFFGFLGLFSFWED